MGLKAIFSMVFVVGLTLIYQNCGNIQMGAKDGGQFEATSFSKTGKIAIFTPESQDAPPPRIIVRKEIEPLALEFGLSENPEAMNYRMEISSGRVVRKQTGSTVYQLSESELTELYAIFEGTILIEWTDLMAGAEPLMCTMDYGYGYALMVTREDEYRLGSGSSGCPFDLFKISSKTKTSLQPFLAKLSGKIR
jgi:hypothetical protein